MPLGPTLIIQDPGRTEIVCKLHFPASSLETAFSKKGAGGKGGFQGLLLGGKLKVVVARVKRPGVSYPTSKEASGQRVLNLLYFQQTLET